CLPPSEVRRNTEKISARCAESRVRTSHHFFLSDGRAEQEDNMSDSGDERNPARRQENPSDPGDNLSGPDETAQRPQGGAQGSEIQDRGATGGGGGGAVPQAGAQGLDIQDYLDATSDASKRSRAIAYAIVIASVLIFS